MDPRRKAGDRSEPEAVLSLRNEQAERRSPRSPLFLGIRMVSLAGNLGSVPQPELALWYSSELLFVAFSTGCPVPLQKKPNMGQLEHIADTLAAERFTTLIQRGFHGISNTE